MVGGAEVGAGRDRVEMVRPEDAFPVGEDPLVLGNSVLDLATGQVRAGQLLPGGDGVWILGSLGMLAFGQRAAVQLGRISEPAPGLVRARNVSGWSLPRTRS